MGAKVHVKAVRRPAEPPRDPVQRQQGWVYLVNQRIPPPGAWTDNRLAQSQHHTGSIFLALSAVQEMMASAVVTCQRRRRRDRTTFLPGGGRAVVKALDGHGGAGNDEDYSPVRDHPLADLLTHPNPNETFGSLLGYATLQWGLTGNAPFWFVPGAAHGRPVELYPLVEALLQPAYGPCELYPEGAWRVTPYYPSGTGWTYGTLATRALSTTILPGTEVRKLKAPHPLTRTDGYSPLTACAVQFDISEAIDLSRHSAFQQGWQTGTLVYVPGISQDQADALAAHLRERYSGPREARRMGVVSSPQGAPGEFKVDRDPPPREMDYVNSWDQATRVVLAVFGQHAAVAGLKDATGYAEFYAAQYQVWHRLSGLARQWGDFFSTHLARPWSKAPGEYRIKVQLPKPRNEETYLATMLSAGQAGIADLNEVRAAIDLRPKPEGDVPVAVYLAKLQQQVAPPPVAGADPAAMLGTGDEQPPGADAGGESATQDAVTQAALEALDVGGQPDPEGSEEMRKAITGPGGKRVVRREGESWWVGDVKYTKCNAKVIRAPLQTRAEQAEGREQVRRDLDAERARRADPSRPSAPSAAAAAAASAPTPTAPTDTEADRLGWDRVPEPRKAAAKQSVAQLAKTPEGKATLAKADAWADAMAAKHADRAAAALKVSPEMARRILAATIRRLCREAIEGGSAERTLDLAQPGGTRLKLGVKKKPGGPTSGAPPRPTNPAGTGSLPPRSVGKAVRPEFAALLDALSEGRS